MYVLPWGLPGKSQVSPWLTAGFQGPLPWRMPGNLVFTRIPGKHLVSSGIVENAIFDLVFTRGKAGNWCGHAAQNSSFFPAISRVFPRYSPGFLPGFWWEASFSPGVSPGEHQGLPRFLPGVYQVAHRVTKNLVFTWGKSGILVRAKKPW